MSEKSADEEHRTVELPSEQMDLVVELALRGLRTVEVGHGKHQEAFDAFVDGAGYPLRIGDQPKNVQSTWNEIIGGKDDE